MSFRVRPLLLAAVLAVAAVGGACGGATEEDSQAISNDAPATSSTTAAPDGEGEGEGDDHGDEGGESGAAGGGAPAATVDVVDNAFEPKTVEVKKGDTVAWEWTTGTTHNITGGPLKSGNKAKKGFVFTHTFEDAGEFKYKCTLHAGMDGEVVVS